MTEARFPNVCPVSVKAASLSVVALILGLALPAAGAQNAPVPDFSGMWGRNAFDFEPLPSGPKPVDNIQRLPDGTSDRSALVGDYRNPILNSKAAEIVRKRGEISLTGKPFPDPSNQCAPYPPPYTLSFTLQTQIVQTRDEIVILYMQDQGVRRIRLNQSHPANLKPSWYGDSVGHFEGDTLVVDTVAFKVGPFSMVDRYGTPLSETLHLVERFRLIDAGAAKHASERHEKENGRIGGRLGAVTVDPAYEKGLQVEFTVGDPSVFTTPWSASVTYQRIGEDWPEYICSENIHEYYSNRDTAVPQADKPDF